MKLSASINFFNGEELLWHTVKNIRPLVEHLSIVYQETSNWNESISDDAKIVIQKLKDANLVDDFFYYQPDFSRSTAENEFQKRAIGLELAKKVKATHFLIMDADEFYIPEQFENAKQMIEAEDITYSGVHSYFYLHKPYFRSEKVDTTNVCFIAKITPELVFEYQGQFPVENVDPTRRLINTSGRFKFFDADIISMHHMNFVREDFDSKLTNTSSASNLDFINNARKALTYWEWPNPFAFPSKPTYTIIKVEDIFHLGSIGYEPKQKILITNHFLKDFTGSEIATLDLAKEFLMKGYNVSVGTFLLANPLKVEFDTLNIKTIDLNNAQSEHFSLIWAHHFTTLDTSIIDKGITADKIIFSSLSPYETLESPPLSIDKVHLFLANSTETKETLLEMGLDAYAIEIFPNPVSDDFFMDYTKKDSSLKKIAIVSNHIPIEIKEIIPLLLNDNIEVNIFGKEGEFQLITPGLLKNFDAVIAIGRTVQYCLAMGIPVYCYDRFGGPGWITQSNIELASQFNFSGRCINHFKTSDEIVSEILHGFIHVRGESPFYKEYAKEYYKLSTLIEKLITKSNSFDHTVGYQKSIVYKNIAVRQRSFFTSEIEQKEFLYRDTLILYNDINKLNLQIKELSKEVITQDAHAQKLAEEVRRLDAHSQSLAQEVIAQDTHAQKLAEEVRRLNALNQELKHELDNEKEKTLLSHIKEQFLKVSK